MKNLNSTRKVKLAKMKHNLICLDSKFLWMLCVLKLIINCLLNNFSIFATNSWH